LPVMTDDYTDRLVMHEVRYKWSIIWLAYSRQLGDRLKVAVNVNNPSIIKSLKSAVMKETLWKHGPMEIFFCRFMEMPKSNESPKL